ncbi:hypothetical protein R3P38DRAFT_2776400 [Favolaschia claudopus]|uniref:Uncharacterized protein n=1 Tax=Favolaschia claudopus TaxID=2862362 RepID=A0AAW0BR81_9AGAR
MPAQCTSAAKQDPDSKPSISDAGSAPPSPSQTLYAAAVRALAEAQNALSAANAAPEVPMISVEESHQRTRDLETTLAQERSRAAVFGDALANQKEELDALRDEFVALKASHEKDVAEFAGLTLERASMRRALDQQASEFRAQMTALRTAMVKRELEMQKRDKVVKSRDVFMETVVERFGDLRKEYDVAEKAVVESRKAMLDEWKEINKIIGHASQGEAAEDTATKLLLTQRAAKDSVQPRNSVDSVPQNSTPGYVNPSTTTVQQHVEAGNQVVQKSVLGPPAAIEGIRVVIPAKRGRMEAHPESSPPFKRVNSASHHVRFSTAKPNDLLSRLDVQMPQQRKRIDQARPILRSRPTPTGVALVPTVVDFKPPTSEELDEHCL